MTQNELRVSVQGFPERHPVQMGVFDKDSAAIIEVLEVI